MREPDYEWEWAESLRLWNEGDIGPLLRFVRSLQLGRSGTQLPDATANQLANVIELLDARTRRGSRRGRPRGTLHRWKDPNYVAAWWIEGLMNCWKTEHRKDRIPDAVKDEKIDLVIAGMGGTKRLDKERIRRILRDPKSRRLPT